MSETSSGPIPGTGYALRRVVVATDLAALRGPLNGCWQLPLHLDSSARTVYDFADPDEREEAYQLVLLEAASPGDLEQWLDGTELLRLWPDLYLPRAVRAAWQAQQPALARIGAGPCVPSCRPAALIDRFQARCREAGPGSRDRYLRHGR